MFQLKSGFFRAEYISYLWIHTNHRLYLEEQHSESFEIWSAIKWINADGKSLIIKMDHAIDLFIYVTTYKHLIKYMAIYV